MEEKDRFYIFLNDNSKWWPQYNFRTHKLESMKKKQTLVTFTGFFLEIRIALFEVRS